MNTFNSLVLFTCSIISLPVLAKPHLIGVWSQQINLHVTDKLNQAPDQWLGLIEDESGFQLRPVKVKFDAPTQSECTSGFDYLGKISAKELPIFIVSGLEKVSTGRKATDFSGNLPLNPGTKVFLGKQGSLCQRSNAACYQLEAFGSWITKDGEKQLQDYRIDLTANEKTSTIFRQSVYFSKAAHLHWAGNFDDDLRPDLILNTNYQLGMAGFTLFLSTKGNSNLHVAPVAEHNPEAC